MSTPNRCELEFCPSELPTEPYFRSLFASFFAYPEISKFNFKQGGRKLILDGEARVNTKNEILQKIVKFQHIYTKKS